MGQAEYFRVKREPNRVDRRVAGELASCSGVNLAVAGFGVGFLLLAGKLPGGGEAALADDGAKAILIRADAGTNRRSRWVR